jgi:hypothetical protein
VSENLTRHFFPFDRLGLVRNPFSALTEDEWAALAWLHPAVKAALDNPSPILQIRAESGRGKSSALLAIKRELLSRGLDPHYVYLEPGVHRLEPAQRAGDPLLLDEIERLPLRTRRRLFAEKLRSTGGLPCLVFSSHADLVPEIEALQSAAAGSVTIPPISQTELADLLNARIRSASSGAGLPVWLTPGAADLLSELYRDDLRMIERELYEVFQRLKQPGEISREALGSLLALTGGTPARG